MTASSSHAVLPLTLVAGTMVLAAAACGGPAGASSGPSAPASTVTVTAPATSAAAGPTSAASTTAASASPTGGAGTATCGVDQLEVAYADDAGGAGAGSVMGRLTFTNTGSTACTLRGFPGVAYVTGEQGDQVGQPATRTGDTATTKTLAPGGRVTAALRRTQPGPYGDACRQAKVAGFRVYPPGSTAAAFVAFPTTGCRSTSAPLLQVAPVR